MMKKYLPVILSVLLVIALAMPAAAGPFADVPQHHWAYEAVKQLAAYGLVIGFPDGEFKGNEPLTRYQMAMVIARLLVSLDAQIKAEIEAAKTVIPEAPAPVEVEKEVIVEQPVIEKVIEKTIVEKLETEALEALEARIAALEGDVEGHDAEVAAKLADLEAKIARGDADNAAAIEALRAELAALEIPVMPEIPDVDAAVSEAIALIDALRAEFITELDVLNARTNVLEGELALAMEKIAALEERADVADLRVDEIDATLAAHLAGHEKVKISGSSEVKFEDVDIRSENKDVRAWKDPSDIFESKREDNHGKGNDVLKEGTDFKHVLELTLTAYPADGVTVKAGLATVTDVFTDSPLADDLKVSSLSLEITTDGILERLYAGGISLPEGTFTPYTFWGEMILDDDNPKYKGVVAELGYEDYSGTFLFTRMNNPKDEEGIRYAFAGEVKGAILDNLNLGIAYVRAWDDCLSGVVDPHEVRKDFDHVVSVSADYEFAEGWKADGEIAKWWHDEGGEGTQGLATRLNLSGVLGPVELEGWFERVPEGYEPEFVDIDSEKWVNDVKSIGVSGEATVLEGLKLSAGYKMTGNASDIGTQWQDWDVEKEGIASVGAEYELAFGGLKLTPSVDAEYTHFFVTSEDWGDGGSLMTVKAGAKAELDPIEASYYHTYARGRVAGDIGATYYNRDEVDIAADYDLTENVNLWGDFNWAKQTVVNFFGFGEEDEHGLELNLGAEAIFPVYEGVDLTAAAEYGMAKDLLCEATPWSKAIVSAGLGAKITPKLSVDIDGEYQRLDRFYLPEDGDQYVRYGGPDGPYVPVTNLIGEINWNYDITTNTVLKLGAKVIKSDVDDNPNNSYIARVVTGSLKVTF